MSGAAHIIIGAAVVGTDSPIGHVRRVIIDPEARTLTHLAVEPAHSRSGGRLVPIGLVDSAADDIQLQCSHEEFLGLPVSDVTEIVGPGNVRAQYEPGGPTPLQMGTPGGFSYGGVMENVHKETSEIVPAGGVERRGNEPVYAADGTIGSVQGFSVDLSSHKVTHVLLAEGLLWGKKLVAIPIDKVTAMEDRIGVGLTRQEVKGLPVADLHQG